MIAVRFTVAGMAKKSGNPAEKIPRGLVEENLHGVPVRGKTINDICDMLFNVQGIVSFLIIPNMDYEPGKVAENRDVCLQSI